jgi:hypothetical protein
MPTVPAVERPDRLGAEVQHVDPSVDGWDTESLNGAAGGQLQKLVADDGVDRAALLAQSFSCTSLRPAERENTFSGPAFRVTRGGTGGERLRGAAGLNAALATLLEPFTGDVHHKFKVVRVVPGEQRRFTTEVLHQAWGEAPRGRLQQNATWSVAWSWPDPAAPPLLEAVHLLRHEEITTPAPLFADCTAAALAGVPGAGEQFLRGTDEWCARIDRAAGMNQYGHNGLAVGDVNGDGLEDVYLCQGGGLPNRLLRQNPDGTVTDIAPPSRIDWLDDTRAALLVDLDNDGHQDLVASISGGVILARGDGTGAFTVRGGMPFDGGYSIAAADYDGDGRLDLYVTRYQTSDIALGLPAPYHDANNGPANALFRNEGNLAFADVTERVGLDDNNSRFSFAAAWADGDGDGDLDLYVANDFGRNNLYRNDRGRFRDVAADAGVEDISAGMGVTWGDPDLDGDLDLYVSNMFSSAGQRITYQRRFRPTTDADTRSAYQRHARGNSLFMNAGDGTFVDATMAAGVWMGRWSWGAQFVDLNNDGLEDLFVPNGFVTNEIVDDL